MFTRLDGKQASPIDDGTDGSAGVRLQSWLDVLWLGAWTDDAQSDGLVVLELEFKDGFDDGLAHGEPVLRLTLFDDAEAGRCPLMSLFLTCRTII